MREYCAGTHNYQLGFPKGLIDPGETPVSGTASSKKKGLALRLSELKVVSLAPSYFNAKMHILVASEPTQNGWKDEPEPLVVVKWPLENYTIYCSKRIY